MIAGIIGETNEDPEIILVAKYVFVQVKAVGFFFMSLIQYWQGGVSYFAEDVTVE